MGGPRSRVIIASHCRNRCKEGEFLEDFNIADVARVNDSRCREERWLAAQRAVRIGNQPHSNVWAGHRSLDGLPASAVSRYPVPCGQATVDEDRLLSSPGHAGNVIAIAARQMRKKPGIESAFRPES
jgi:hypothetical protein